MPSLSLSLLLSSLHLARSVNSQKHQLSLACADCCLKCFPMNSKCVLCSGFASQNLLNPFRVCVELLWLPQLLGLGTINERKAIRTCRKFNSLLATYPVSTRAIHCPPLPFPHLFALEVQLNILPYLIENALELVLQLGSQRSTVRLLDCSPAVGARLDSTRAFLMST